MKKIFIITAILTIISPLFGVLPVQAQVYSYQPSYYPTNYNYAPVAPTYPTNYSNPVYTPTTPTYAQPGQTTLATCLNINQNLFIGTQDIYTGGQVSTLQQFLINQNYLNITSPTGFFGSLTSASLARYQRDHGIAATGILDATTRVAIESQTCGNLTYTNPYNPYNPVPVANLSLGSLSVNSGSVGTSVTIYGTGFDYSNNTVNFGGVPVTGLLSNGSSLTFVVPQVSPTCQYQTYPYQNSSCINNNYLYTNSYNTQPIVYQVTVSDSRGTSNALTFSFYQNGDSYNNTSTGLPTIGSINGPTNIAVGTPATWSFVINNPTNGYVTASVTWGDQNTYYAYNNTVATPNSQSVYTYGSQTISFSHTYQTAGTYTVVFTVTNSNGQQNSTSASVNVSGSSYYNGNGQNGPLSLSYLSPTAGTPGSQLILQGSGFSLSGNTVHFGTGGTANVSSTNGTTIYYSVPTYMTNCNLTPGVMCSDVATVITPGSYPVYVSNSSGQTSNILYFTVVQ